MEASFLARESAKEMLSRLELMKLQPRQVLDVGCGTGTDMEILAERYPQAQVFGLDLAQSFLDYGKKQRAGCLAWLVGDGHTLPLRSHSVDLIFANLLLPWVANPAAVLREWRRVLRPEGLVLFSCLGPDTFKEWQALENANLLPGLVDMHKVGDALVEQGFADPVLEVETLTLTYRSASQCFKELEKSGMCSQGASIMDLPSSEGVYPVTFEVVYGHAWCPTTKGFKPDEQGVIRIPISQIKF